MSGHHIFGILLVICGWSLSCGYRLLEGQDNFKTCPAPIKERRFDEQHLRDQQRNFYNVHEVPRKPPPSNINEIKSENLLMRIINIRTIKQNSIQEDSGIDHQQHMDGFAQRLLNIFRSKREDPSPKNNNEPKIFFILKKHPQHREEHHIVKRDPLPSYPM